jgi:hypothetical protein
VFTYDIVWSSSDPDMDNVTFTIFYKMESDDDWTRIAGGITATIYTWNLTDHVDGQYFLRILARDSSDKALTSEIFLGPFTLDIPWYPPETDDDDVGPDDDDEDTDEGIELGLIVAIAVGSVLLVVFIVVGILFILSRTTRKEVEEPVIPTEGGLDLSIPEFDRSKPPVYSGQMVTQGAYGGIQQQTLPPEDHSALQPPVGQESIPPTQHMDRSLEQPMSEPTHQDGPIIQEEEPIPFQSPEQGEPVAEQQASTDQEVPGNQQEETQGVPQAPPPLPPDLD